jgi:hypothetical protein
MLGGGSGAGWMTEETCKMGQSGKTTVSVKEARGGTWQLVRAFRACGSHSRESRGVSSGSSCGSM